VTSDYEFESTPEDAWSPGDTVEEMVHNLCARCALLDHGPRLPEGPGGNTVPEMMDELKERVLAKLKQRDISDVDKVRAELILEDVETVLAKFGAQ
jgi:hypothetical protein